MVSYDRRESLSELKTSLIREDYPEVNDTEIENGIIYFPFKKVSISNLKYVSTVEDVKDQAMKLPYEKVNPLKPIGAN